MKVLEECGGTVLGDAASHARLAMPSWKGWGRPDLSTMAKAVRIKSSLSTQIPDQPFLLHNPLGTKHFSSSLVKMVEGPGLHSILTLPLVLRLNVSTGILYNLAASRKPSGSFAYKVKWTAPYVHAAIANLSHDLLGTPPKIIGGARKWKQHSGS